MFWKKWFVIFCMFICFFGIDKKAMAQDSLWDTQKTVKITRDNIVYFSYLSKDGEKSWIYRIGQKKNENMELLSFPKKINGAKVVKIGGKNGIDDYTDIWGNIVEPYHNYDSYDKMPKGIRQIKLPSSVTQITAGTFGGFRDLQQVTLPKKIKNLKYGVFYHCDKLKKVILPTRLKKIDSQAFLKCTSLMQFSISDNNTYKTRNGILLSKDGKKIEMIPSGKKEIVIPEKVETIPSRTFYNGNVQKIFIPFSVREIEDMGLTGKKLRQINISEKNSVYGKSGDCIYSKEDGKLVAAVCRRGVLKISGKVKKITSDLSFSGKKIKKLVIPKSIQFIGNASIAWFSLRMSSGGCIYFRKKEPPIAENGFIAQTGKISISVPENSLNIYKKWYKKVEGTEKIDSKIKFVTPRKFKTSDNM